MADLYSYIHLSLSLSLLFHLLLGDLQRQFVLGSCTIAKFFAKLAKLAKTAENGQNNIDSGFTFETLGKAAQLTQGIITEGEGSVQLTSL
jgi:hypothetical protein